MAGKKGDDGSKKAAGQARKAQTAANKAAAENAKKAAEEAADWDRGAKNNSKKEAQEAKKAEQARKKAEKEALAAEEEKSLPTRPGPKNSKKAVKKTNQGLNLEQLGLDDDKKLRTMEGSGMDTILDILDVAVPEEHMMKVDRHPNRRVNAAYTVFRERRLGEMKEDGTGQGLRLHIREDIIKKEWKTSPENPIHDPRNVKYNAKKDEIKAVKQGEMDRIEALYGEDSK